MGAGQSTSAGTTSFYWIGFEPAMEYDASGLVSRQHRGAGFKEVVSAYQRDIADLDQDGSTTDYLPLTPLYDGAYDCVGVLDHTGAVAESYVHAYDGLVTITNAAGGTISTSALGWQQGFGRMYRDAESGLLYAVHRYCSAATGRFLTIDPLGAWFDIDNTGNGFAALANNYRNRWDPLGLESKTGAAAMAKALGGAAEKAGKSGTTDNVTWSNKPYGLELTTPQVLEALAYAARNTAVTMVDNVEGAEAVTNHVSGDPKKDPKYTTDADKKDWEAKAGDYDRMFLMLHELLHAALHKLGAWTITTHHSDDLCSKSYKEYQWHVLRILKLLMAADPKAFEGTISADDLKALEKAWGERPAPTR